MESAAGEKGKRIHSSERVWPPASDAGKAGGKPVLTQVSAGPERVTG